MKYTSPGFRSVEACSIRAAAVIFAERAARKLYGKSGCCRSYTEVACSTDGTIAEYSAFIGYTPRGQCNETAGHNQSFVVYAAQQSKTSVRYPAIPGRYKPALRNSGNQETAWLMKDRPTKFQQRRGFASASRK
jgi:hypothetical protein